MGKAAAVSPRLAMLMLGITVLAWGFGWPVNKLLLEAITPLWAIGLRSAMATVALFAIAGATGRLTLPARGDMPIVVSIALLHMVGYSVLVSLGLALVPAGRSVVLAYTTPLWVVPGARLFLGERLTARRLLGTALGIGGLLVLFNPLAFDWQNEQMVIGNMVLVAAALFWAASILHIRGHRWQGTAFDLLPWEALLASGVLLTLAYAVEGEPGVVWTGKLLALLVYASLPGTALTYWAVATASRGLPAATTSLGLLGVPPVTILVAAAWLGEPITLTLLLAIGMIISGVALGTIGCTTTRASRAPS